ncbi:MAG: oligopeptidase A [Pseudomonadota bacterium]
MTNVLLEDHELPPFSRITAAQVEPAIDSLLEQNRTALAEMLARGEASWDGLVKAQEENDDRLARAFAPVSHLNSVMNSAELRGAYDACLPKLSDYYTEVMQNRLLFEAYESLRNSAGFASLGTAEKKVIDNTIRDFRLAGVDLPAADQERFAAISRRLSELSSQFGNNVLDATMAWTGVFDTADELAGLPASTLALAAQNARQRGLEGYLFTLDAPCYLPVMTYCENRAFRRDMYEAFVTRASELGPNGGEFDNSDIMQEILALRQEKARLLGYGNFAELSLATRMARTTAEVMNFLTELATRVRPKAEEEFAEICEFARARFGAETLEAWDLAFYAEKLKQERYAISDEDLRPYFPAPRVLTGMFEVVRRLYDIEVRETHDMETWHPDVSTYGVYRQGKLIARFYLDLYARANKRGGAWMDDCRVRRVRRDGSLQLPVAFLTCNFSAPVDGQPALLTHNEVTTLFHEFGHGLHHMLTRVDAAAVSGINGVSWDAVELPSQIMENWCWESEALEFISSHVETGEPLPAALLEKMLAARNYQSAMMTVRQLEFALFDFRLHMLFDAAAGPDQVQQVLADVRSEVSVVPVPGFNRFQHGFSHVFAGGYAAGYYSYKWAEVLSADAFALFRSQGIFNRQTGERFLDTVLEQGGSVDAMALFVAFRGREPDINALLRQDGIVQGG